MLLFWTDKLRGSQCQILGVAAREARIAKFGGSNGVDKILENEINKVRNESIATVTTSNSTLEASLREAECEFNEHRPGFTMSVTTNSTKTYTLSF